MRVGVGSLTTDRHTPPVSYSTITAKVHQSFDVHGNFTPQFALYLVIAVDERVIRLQGKPIITVKDAMKSDKNAMQPLFNALRVASVSVKDISDKKGVTIMGDREIPYVLLKKIMLTCAGAKYTNISFAVNPEIAFST